MAEFKKASEGELEKLLGLDSPISNEPKTQKPSLEIPAQSNIDEEDEEVSQILSGQQEYKRVGFEDPVEMLFTIDPQLANGSKKLHSWQMEDLIFLSRNVGDYEERLRYCLTAANGSGKDAFIIAPFAVWQLTECVRSRFIATSKSAHQLTTQTTQYIKQYVYNYGAFLRNQGFHAKPFIVRNRPFHIVCSFSGAEILAFVTDQAENIEGYHPWPDAPKAPLTIAINEAKGVPDEYFDGFSRCTYSCWLEITSPGRQVGRNWEHYNSSVKHPAKRELSRFYSRKITSYDCPHKSPKIIEEDAVQYGGKDSELFRSKHLAEYTTIGENVVINLEVIDKFLNNPPIEEGFEKAAGLDLSLGGDETVLVIRQGNTTKSIDGTRIKDATILESYLDKLFHNRGLTAKDPIFTDIGGLGQPIAHTLKKMGWNIIYILNNAVAIGFDKNLYGNRGTEMFFEVCNYYARGFIKPLKDKLWREQLGSRKYIRPDNEKLKMQPKAQFKRDVDRKSLANSAEWESPDRADAWILAYANYEPLMVKQERQAKKDKKGNLSRITHAQLIKEMEDQRFAGYKKSEGLLYKPSSNSQRSIIKEQLNRFK